MVPLSLIVAGPHGAIMRRTTGDENFRNSYSLLRSEESPMKTAPIVPGPNLSDTGRKIPGPTGDSRGETVDHTMYDE
jgi:hypothetical protein